MVGQCGESDALPYPAYGRPTEANAWFKCTTCLVFILKIGTYHEAGVDGHPRAEIVKLKHSALAPDRSVKQFPRASATPLLGVPLVHDGKHLFVLVSSMDALVAMTALPLWMCEMKYV